MKVPYQIRIEPEMLDQLKQLAKENGTSVNHEIRQAIRGKLIENEIPKADFITNNMSTQNKGNWYPIPEELKTENKDYLKGIIPDKPSDR